MKRRTPKRAKRKIDIIDALEELFKTLSLHRYEVYQSVRSLLS